LLKINQEREGTQTKREHELKQKGVRNANMADDYQENRGRKAGLVIRAW